MKKLLTFFAALTLSAGLWADVLEDAKTAAVEEIEFAIVGVTDTDILAIANTAKTDINAATTKENVETIKTLAIAKINALVAILTARQGIQNTEINMMINDAVNSISSTTTKEQITDAQFKAMTIIGLFQNGKNEAKAELLGDMAEPCTGCTAVEVSDGTTTVTLYNATNVGYIKK